MPTPDSPTGGATTVGSVTFLDPAIPWALEAITTPFLAVSQPHATLPNPTVDRHVQGLLDHPEAVFSFSPTPRGPSTPVIPDGALDRILTAGDPRCLDGREIARSLLFSGGAPPIVPSLVLLSASAVGDEARLIEALSGGEGVTVDWYRLVLELLTAGSAWLDPTPVGRSPMIIDPDVLIADIDRALWSRWSEVLAAGADLGLLDQPGDSARALIGATRRDAQLLRRLGETAIPVRLHTHEPAAILDRAMAPWRTLIAGEAIASTGDDTFGDEHAKANGDRGLGGMASDHPVHRLSSAAGTDWLPEPARRARPQPLHTFVVVAPDYTEGHGGVVALHRLCDRLNVIGYEAFIHPIGAKAETRPGWRTPLHRGRSLRDAVVVYPEIVTGNLLGAERVVRWLLNRPGWFTGLPMEEGPSDLLVTFNRQISAKQPLLTVPLIDPTIFFPKSGTGHGKLVWIGKGTVPARLDRAGTTLITPGWPGDRRHFADVLRAADVLYTCDWLTSVIDEALMCGTPVVLVGDQEWERGEVPLRPGMAWEGEEDLDDARQEVGHYFSQYLDGLVTVNDAVEGFVQLVNDHFEGVATP